MRVLRATRARRRRPRRARVAVHRRGGLGRRSRVRARLRARRRRGRARGDAAQAPRRLPRRQAFVDTNVTGTLNLLEEAVAAGVGRFVFTSTTSAFGRALTPPPGAPAAWITEDVAPVPRNIYGATKTRRGGPCELVHRDHGLPVPDPAHLALLPRGRRPRRGPRRLRRRQPEGQRAAVSPRRPRGRGRARTGCALERAPAARLRALHRQRHDARSRATTSPSCAPTRPAVVRRAVPRLRGGLRRGAAGAMFPSSSASTSTRARASELGWAPRYDFRHALDRLAAGEDPRSPLAAAVGAKGYHAESTGPYTVR